MGSYKMSRKEVRLDGWIFNIALIGAVISILMILVLPDTEFSLPTSENVPFYKNYRIMIYVYLAALYCVTAVISRLWQNLAAAAVNVFFSIGLLIMSMFSGSLFFVMVAVALLNIVVAFIYFASSYNRYKNKKLAERRAEKAKGKSGSSSQNHHREHRHEHHHHEHHHHEHHHHEHHHGHHHHHSHSDKSTNG